MGDEENPAVLAWRLDKLDETVGKIDKKLDSYLTMQTQIATLGVIVDGLVKSRDKQIAALSAISVGLVLTLVELVFDLI